MESVIVHYCTAKRHGRDSERQWSCCNWFSILTCVVSHLPMFASKIFAQTPNLPSPNTLKVISVDGLMSIVDANKLQPRIHLEAARDANLALRCKLLRPAKFFVPGEY